MAGIARAAGISKALLYHYFPAKQAYFAATLARAGEEIRAATEPDLSLPPAEALTASLDAFLIWIAANRGAYMKVMQSASRHPEVRELIDAVRGATAQRILEGLSPASAPAAGLRTAVRAWLWFMDGACLDWLEHDDLTRDQLRGLLLGTLMGAIIAAGGGDVIAPITQT